MESKIFLSEIGLEFQEVDRKFPLKVSGDYLPFSAPNLPISPSDYGLLGF